VRSPAAGGLAAPLDSDEQPPPLQSPQSPGMGRALGGRPPLTPGTGAPRYTEHVEDDLGPHVTRSSDPSGLGLELAENAPLQPA
jgi:hypothetical protein